MGNNCWICGKENLHPDGIHTCSYRPEILELIEKAKAQAVAEFVEKLRELCDQPSIFTGRMGLENTADDLLRAAESLLSKEEKEVKE